MAVIPLFFLSFSAIPDTIYVNCNSDGANNGTSWGDAFADLETAISTAKAGDELWVAAGTYKPSVKHGGTTDRHKTFQLKNGVSIHGGFNGTGCTENGGAVQNTGSSPFFRNCTFRNNSAFHKGGKLGRIQYHRLGFMFNSMETF